MARIGHATASSLVMALMATASAFAQGAPTGSGATAAGGGQPTANVGPILGQPPAPSAAVSSEPAPGAAAGPIASPSGSGVLNEIIVTAQRRAENLERTPVAITAINGDSLRRAGVSTEADLQAVAPGLLVKASQNSNQLNFAVRGQSVDAFSSVRPGVLPYVNEVQVGGSAAGALYDLQSVQVLKGPQGTLFGRNATGGAVLFTTASPGNQLGGYAEVRGGTYDLLQAEGAVNLPLIQDKLLARVSGVFESRDGYQTNLFDGSHVGNVRRVGGRLSLTYKPTSKLENDLVIDYLHSGGSSLSGVLYSIYPIGFNNAPAPANVLFSPAVDAAFGPGAFARYLAAHPDADPDGIVAFGAKQKQRGPFLIDVNAPNFHKGENVVLSDVTKYDLAPDLQIKNILGATVLRSNDGGEFDGSPYGIDDNGDQGRRSTTRQLSEELQVLGKAFDHKLSYVAGVYVSNEETVTRSLSVIFDLSPNAPPNLQINNGTTNDKTYAVYAQGTYDLSDLTGVRGLSFTAGGRYTVEQVQFKHRGDDVFLQTSNSIFVNPESDEYDEPSWQFGFQEQLNRNLLLYVTTRHSFRSGGFNFFDPPIPGFGNNGGSEYKPETDTDVEVGAKFDGRVLGAPSRLNLAAYNLWIDDAQRVTYVSILGAPSGVTVNVPSTTVVGFEADGLVAPTPWLTLGATLSYADGEFTDNKVSVNGGAPTSFGPYPDLAKFSGGAYADITFPVAQRFNATLHADTFAQTSTVFSSTEKTLNPGAVIPGYAIANFRVSLDDPASGWSVSLNLKNALDKTYYVGGLAFGSLFTLNTAVPGDPRTFMAEVRKKF